MNRAFKTQFFGSHADQKTIVTMGITVNNGKRFKDLSQKDRKSLIKHLETFEKQVESFKDEIETGWLHNKKYR